MRQSLVPGRLLSFAALLASCLLIYVVRHFLCSSRFDFALLAIISFCVALIFIEINPAIMPLKTDSFLNIQKVIDSIHHNGNPFKNGRFTWIGVAGSEMSVFSI